MVPPVHAQGACEHAIGDSNKNGLAVSFEVFPPRDKSAEDQLIGNIRSLEVLHPRFVSVTYGAGGSTRKNTLSTAARIGTQTTIPPAAHLTCVGATRPQVDSVARNFWDAGIRHIVALRGDPPGQASVYAPHPGGYAYGADLVAGLKRIADFEISVAAYPEGHPEAANGARDLTYLKQKLDAGACRAITQFFFDPEKFLRFVDRARAAGINAPIVAGIMPMGNFEKIRKFARHCGVTIPTDMALRFADARQDPAECRQLAIAAAAKLCQQLYVQGQREFHFYTLNDAGLVAAIFDLLDDFRCPFHAAPRPPQ